MWHSGAWAPFLLQAPHGRATDNRGAWRDLEIDQTSPVSVFPASTWQAWGLSHLFAESELYVLLLPALRWWTSVSLAAFWKGREESQIGHPVYQHKHLVCAGAKMISYLHHNTYSQPAIGTWSGITRHAMSTEELTYWWSSTTQLYPHVTQSEVSILWDLMGGILNVIGSEMPDIKKIIIMHSLFSQS